MTVMSEITESTDITDNTEPSLRVLDIVPGTSVDGPGLRTSIYFAGCDHRCPGCHNPQSWDTEGGVPMPLSRIVDEVERHGFNITFSGGDPLMHPRELAQLAGMLRARGYRLWCYTGFRYEELHDKDLYRPLLEQLDVLVDGPFIQELRDIHLRFRGSSNQRLIDMHRTLASGSVTLWHDPADDIALPPIPH